METELLRDYGFGWEQLAEVLGHACAVAITKVYPLSSLEKHQPTVLVICGPGHNGCVGLVCARYLHLFDYIPTVFCPARSRDALHQSLTVQCEKMDLPFLSDLPTETQNRMSRDTRERSARAAGRQKFPSSALTVPQVGTVRTESIRPSHDTKDMHSTLSALRHPEEIPAEPAGLL